MANVWHSHSQGRPASPDPCQTIWDKTLYSRQEIMLLGLLSSEIGRVVVGPPGKIKSLGLLVGLKVYCKVPYGTRRG